MNYVYRLTEKSSGKIYIGSRYSKNASPEDLGISYFTSSTHVSLKFKECPDNFHKDIIYVGTDARLVENALLMSIPKEERKNYLNRRFHKDGFSSEVSAIGVANANAKGAAQKGAKASVATHGPQMANGGKRGGVRCFELGVGMHTFEHRSNAGKIATSHKYKCHGCSMETHKGPMAGHQRRTGHSGMSAVSLKENEK